MRAVNTIPCCLSIRRPTDDGGDCNHHIIIISRAFTPRLPGPGPGVPVLCHEVLFHASHFHLVLNCDSAGGSFLPILGGIRLAGGVGQTLFVLVGIGREEKENEKGQRIEKKAEGRGIIAEDIVSWRSPRRIDRLVCNSAQASHARWYIGGPSV